ncbi:MAG: hypothetical protein E7632_00265 [Ruminococcaceae bacterium]|nr:hypothetical protein [Oscillospiraceae bacterium]
MGIVRGIFKVAGTAVLGAAGTAAAILKTAVESTGNDADLLQSLQDASFKTIGKMWGAEVDDTPKSDEEIRRHQIEVRRKGMHTAKEMADIARRAGDEDKYNQWMERYEQLKEEVYHLEHPYMDIGGCEDYCDEELEPFCDDE